jgi:hypothetical protein
MDFLEALLTLLPAEAGGRSLPIRPRDGSYRPFAISADGARLRIRVIEGPPELSPGQDARIVAEIESMQRAVAAGNELSLVESDDRCVGILTVMRLCRAATA